MTYEIAKFLHITGVVMLMGNITVTAIWKYFADRTQRPEVLSFAQKLVTYTDWSMTVWGVVLLMGGGYFMVFSVNWPLTLHWLPGEPNIIRCSRSYLASFARAYPSTTSTAGKEFRWK